MKAILSCVVAELAVTGSLYGEIGPDMRYGMVPFSDPRVVVSESCNQEETFDFPEGVPCGEDLEWTFLFYDDADCPDMYDPIDHFREEFTSGSGIEVLVLQDPENSEAMLYRVLPDGSLVLLEAMGEINMGSGAVLRGFIAYGKENYPAERYMLAMYDHGGGWAGACWDVTSSWDHLTMEEIRYAIAHNGGVDLLAYTGPCLMGALESAYHLIGCIDVCIGSEEPSGYFLWKGKMDEICNMMKNNHSATTQEIADYIIEQITENFVPPYFEGGTLCAVCPDSLIALAQELDELSIYMQMNMNELGGSLQAARSEAYQMGLQIGTRCGEIDFAHFLQVYSTHESDPVVLNHISNLLELYDSSIINECHGVLAPDARGMSIYFPSVLEGYDFESYCIETLELLNDTHWEEALEAYYSWLELGVCSEEQSVRTTIVPSSNPCSGNTGVTCICRGSGEAVFSVFDLTGRQVYRSNFNAAAGEAVVLQWGSDNKLSSGIYLLRLDSPDGTAASHRIAVVSR